MEDFSFHAIKRAKERYNLDLTIFDLMMILVLIRFKIAKEIKIPKNVFGQTDKNAKYFHLRYGGQLILPVIREFNHVLRVVTFLTTGKNISSKRNYVNIDHTERTKRMGKRKRDTKQNIMSKYKHLITA